MKSSSIASVGYDPQTSLLEVEFVSGETYRYFHVPAQIHRDFVAATSKGHFFAHAIRGRFRYERIQTPRP